MKKHRRLEARKRVNELLTQHNEAQTDQAKQALARHLEVLEKNFFTDTQINKQKRKNEKIAVA